MFSIPQDTAMAMVKLLLTFASMIIMLKLRMALWKTIGAGCLVLAISTMLPLASWVQVPAKTLISEDFLIMEVMLFGILLLSGVQGATGQSQRLVAGLERYLRWPRIRLVIFPALVGLLPMPGGALFSCPMLDAAAHGMKISSKRKTLINYWFRHIWELAWPLYPGYILVSSLLGLPLLTLIKYTAPLVLFSFITGWFFYMRDIDVTNYEHGNNEPQQGGGLGVVLYESLPIIITIAGAAVAGLILGKVAPNLPSQTSFLFSTAAGVLTAVYQGRGRFEKSFKEIAFSKGTVGLLLLIYTIYLFKNLIDASGIVSDLSHVGKNVSLVYALFIILPLICGMLTGIMVGYVGACFPILLGIATETGMQAELVPLIILAVIAGNVGQLITPLHVCIVVSCQYYKVHFAELWRSLIPPLTVQMTYGILWAAVLHFTGASFW